MKTKKQVVASLSFVGSAFLPNSVLAHCPLCTAGAVAAGGVAAWLGVSAAVVGVFIGGASLLLGWWLAKMVKRKIIPYQTPILAFVAYLSIVAPAYPFVKGYSSVYLSWFGEYGTMFHNTYIINLFLLGSALGAIVVLVSPRLSAVASSLANGRRIPFQGVVVTLVALVIASALIELIV